MRCSFNVALRYNGFQATDLKAATMERRVLLAFLLSFLVLYGYQALFVPPPPESNPPSVPNDLSAAEVNGVGVSSDSMRSSGSLDTAVELVAAADANVMPSPLVTATALEDSVVETDAFRAVFSNQGARLVSWQLKDYVDEISGMPVDLVPRSLPEDEPSPFTLTFDDALLTARANGALYRASARELQLAENTGTLTFDFEDTGGLRIQKTFRFDPVQQPFVVNVLIDVTLSGQALAPTIQWGPALGGVESGSTGIAYRVGPRGVIFGRVQEDGVLAEEDINRPDAGDVVERPIYRGLLRFAGVDNHYFLVAALPGNVETAISYRSVPLPALELDGEARDLMAFDMTFQADQVAEVPFFLGPKDFEVLEATHSALVRSIEYGWLAWLVVPLHRSLTTVHAYVGNWGWAIIILTILINLVIFPLRHKSVVSMRKMQELQPEMKAIQERYKNLKTTNPDKQKMNQEIMSLYRERGVNPAGGCLPMLLTMPVLFAFYRLLSLSVEIRGEPFVGWITDLSLADPFYVTPVVMGATMVLQQKMTPSQADPMQQKIMMIMPVMFTGMFIFAPSGLVLYWLTSNVFGIGQQVLTNKYISPPRVRTERPGETRPTKKAIGTKNNR